MHGGKGRWRNRLIVLMVCIAILVVGVTVALGVRRVFRERALLRAVDLPGGLRYASTGYVNWTDWLSYTDGYEILAARVEPAEWSVPESWHSEAVSLEALEKEHLIYLNRWWFEEHHIPLDQTFDGWYFHETDREPWAEYQFFLGLHREDGTLIVYRGHDLWGSLCEKNIPEAQCPSGCSFSILAIDQNFREFSLMPGPMVLDSTADRI